MLATQNKMIAFSEWLLLKLEEKDLSQADLARASGLARATISDIISGRRQAGKDVATAIARALKIPTEQVFRAAGILPPEPASDPWVDEMSHKLRQLSPSLRSVADRMIDGLIKEEEANEKPKAKPKSARA